MDHNEPVAWWNGFRYSWRTEDTGPSFSEREDTWHDIPLYSHPNPNPCNAAQGQVSASVPRVLEALGRIVDMCAVPYRCACGRPNGLGAIVSCAQSALRDAAPAASPPAGAVAEQLRTERMNKAARGYALAQEVAKPHAGQEPDALAGIWGQLDIVNRQRALIAELQAQHEADAAALRAKDEQLEDADKAYAAAKKLCAKLLVERGEQIEADAERLAEVSQSLARCIGNAAHWQARAETAEAARDQLQAKVTELEGKLNGRPQD